MPKTTIQTDAPLPDDPPKMVQAIDRLNSLGIMFERKTLYQLKIDQWNFYPGRGTIVRDGGLPEQHRGLLALLERVRRPSKNRASPAGPAVAHNRLKRQRFLYISSVFSVNHLRYLAVRRKQR